MNVIYNYTCHVFIKACPLSCLGWAALVGNSLPGRYIYISNYQIKQDSKFDIWGYGHANIKVRLAFIFEKYSE